MSDKDQNQDKKATVVNPFLINQAQDAQKNAFSKTFNFNLNNRENK